MLPAYVKPYVKTQKNDEAEADAICEVVTRPNMRFAEPRASARIRSASSPVAWPQNDEVQLGLTILLARRFADDSHAVLNFAHTLYYNCTKITPNLQHMVGQLFVPFELDFSWYVTCQTGTAITGEAVAETPKYPCRVFVVHGHDAEARETVARFLERLKFEAVILHEQANRGRTIIEKFEACRRRDT